MSEVNRRRFRKRRITLLMFPIMMGETRLASELNRQFILLERSAEAYLTAHKCRKIRSKCRNEADLTSGES
jgi:hypothetical protein